MINEKRLISTLKKTKEVLEPDSLGLYKINIESLIGIVEGMDKIGEWIPVTERLPEEHDSLFAKHKGTSRWCVGMFEKMSDTVMATVKLEDGTRKVMSTRTIDGKWSLENTPITKKVIAWMPLPEPYRDDCKECELFEKEDGVIE